jgi:DNA primase
MSVAEIDFVVKAPDGKEVEELTKKEIHKALRGKATAEQAKLDVKDSPQPRTFAKRPVQKNTRTRPPARTSSFTRAPTQRFVKKVALSSDLKTKFKKLLDDLVGTRGAYILDGDMKILGKVPSAELENTLRSLKNINSIVFDGSITKDLAGLAEKNKVKFLIGMDSKIKESETKVRILTKKSF